MKPDPWLIPTALIMCVPIGLAFAGFVYWLRTLAKKPPHDGQAAPPVRDDTQARQ